LSDEDVFPSVASFCKGLRLANNLEEEEEYGKLVD
jgi:hypothetical protein